MAAFASTNTHRKTPMRHVSRSHPAARKATGKYSIRKVKHRKASFHGPRRKTRHRSQMSGQRVMDPQRATEIQQALIQAHYLNGSPTGQWDAESQAAMVKYQADNGWQSRITPDSRALIKLGLGPKQDAGEYATTATGLSRTIVPPETIRTVANSGMPAATTQN